MTKDRNLEHRNLFGELLQPTIAIEESANRLSVSTISNVVAATVPAVGGTANEIVVVVNHDLVPALQSIQTRTLKSLQTCISNSDMLQEASYTIGNQSFDGLIAGKSIYGVLRQFVNLMNAGDVD